MITLLTMILAVLVIIAALLAGVIDALYKLPAPDPIPYETLQSIDNSTYAALNDMNAPGFPVNFR